MHAGTRPDLVDIVTPTASHAAIAAAASASGAVSVCQKPLAPTFAEAGAMVGAAERAGDEADGA